MGSREERMADNEAASRESEDVRPGDRHHDCRVPTGTNDPLQFAIVPDHLVGDIERIVYENDRFAVVVKQQGIPAEVAIEEGPPG
jgi:23S rRNA-/tRNA-specific pseudouridylate synthase